MLHNAKKLNFCHPLFVALYFETENSEISNLSQNQNPYIITVKNQGNYKRMKMERIRKRKIFYQVQTHMGTFEV